MAAFAVAIAVGILGPNRPRRAPNVSLVRRTNLSGYHCNRIIFLLRIYITTEAGFRFQTEFETEVNLSIGLKPYFRV